jgi:hypothetical protein
MQTSIAEPAEPMERALRRLLPPAESAPRIVALCAISASSYRLEEGSGSRIASVHCSLRSSSHEPDIENLNAVLAANQGLGGRPWVLLLVVSSKLVH